MEITDEQILEFSLTPEQLKAAKKVYTAMKAAGKIGVNFWDNYGALTAYNSKKICVPHMDISWAEKNGGNYFRAESGQPGNEVLYWENLKNFSGGNADDEFYAQIL